jgi:hypothetical protein
MDPLFLHRLNIDACIAAAAFFGAFVSTFGKDRFYPRLAAVFYSIGVVGCFSPLAYLNLFGGESWTFGRFPVMDWLVPVLSLCFALIAVVLLWPTIPQKIAVRFGMVLFGVFAPTLIMMRLFPEYLQFHRIFNLDFRWLLYAILWFRIRESYVEPETR